jgi:putative FmdB family regulatory protein
MPTYEYECLACKHRFERVQKFSDAPVTECPECGSQVRKVLFPAGVVFKGSGWYITDSRKSTGSESGASAGAKTETKADSKSETKTESKSDSKAESKTESKSETKPAPKSDSSSSTKSESSTPAKA